MHKKFEDVKSFLKNLLFGTKGQAVNIGNIALIGTTLVVAVLTLAFAGDVLSDINSDQTANSAAANISSNGLTGLLNVTGQLPSVGTVLGAALIIGILATAFFIRRSNN